MNQNIYRTSMTLNNHQATKGPSKIIGAMSLIYPLTLLTNWGLRPLTILSSFEGMNGLYASCTTCYCVVAIIDQTNVAMPFVVTVCPALCTAHANHTPVYDKMSGVNLASTH